MQTVYVVEGYDMNSGRYRDVYANRDTAIQHFDAMCSSFNGDVAENIIKREKESFSLQEIDEGFIRFANLSETEYIGVFIKTVNKEIPTL